MTALWMWFAACGWPGQEDYLAVRAHLQDRDGDGDSPPMYGGGDCDDEDAEVHSRAIELCNGVDDDCDGVVDGENATDRVTWGLDLDGDGFGRADQTLVQCEEPTGYVADVSDCDDDDPGVHPEAQEMCDDLDVDEDCDGLADDADDTAAGQTPWPVDLDGDGYGSEETGLQCDPGGDYVAEGGDCDDGDAGVNPGAVEVCENGVDDDCDGTYGACFWNGDLLVDDADASVFGVEPGARAGLRVAADCGQQVEPRGIWITASDSVSGDGVSGRVFRVDLPLPGTLLLSDTLDQIVDSEDQGSFGGAVVGCSDPAESGSRLYIDSPYSDYGAEDGGAVLVFTQEIQGSVDAASAAGQILGDTSGQALGGRIVLTSSLTPTLSSGLAVASLGTTTSGLAGSVYLVEGAEGTHLVSSQAHAVITGESAGDAFGIFMDVAPDLDGDGVEDLVVVANTTVTLGLEGRVYIFHGPVAGDLVAAAADSTISGETYLGLFGLSLTVPGDLDGDGLADLLMGAVADNDGSSDFGGAVYGFNGTLAAGDHSPDEALFRVLGQEALSFFGATVIGTDLDGDQQLDVLVGAHEGGSSGEVHLFRGPLSGSLLQDQAIATVTGTGTDSGLGYPMFALGDLDGDGWQDVGLSARDDATVAEESGAVYFFFGSGW